MTKKLSAFSERVPTHQELLWPALLALRNLGGSGSIGEHLDQLISDQHISDTVSSQPHGESDRTELAYRLAWARTALRRTDFVQNSRRGVWSVSQRGDEATESDVLGALQNLRLVDRKKRLVLQDQESDLASGELSYDWREDLLFILRRIDPAAFERLCQRLLRESGFVKVEVTGRSGDGGIDGTGILQLSLMSFHVLFQCKRYQGSVGAATVRDFRGAMMGRTDKGLIITTGSFSPDARREATRDGAPPIDLIDGDSLCDKLKELSLGVDTRLVEEISIRSDWFEQL